MSDDTSKGANPRRPAVFRMESDKPAPEKKTAERAARPAERRRPVALPADSVTIDEADPFAAPESDADLIAEAEGLTPEPARPRERRFSFGKLAAGAFGVLVSLAVGLWTDQLIRSLFARADWLGYFAIAAVAVFLLGLFVVIAREMIALMRLSTLREIHEEAASAAADPRPARARALVKRLVAMTADKPETARGRAAIADMEDEIVDAPQLMAFAEAELMVPLDIRARRLILNASKRVSIVTAVSPRAVVDLAYVLYESARLVRAMATLYGGRPGTLGLMRLFRDVLAHLAVTSSIAVGDSLIQQIVGHGVASRLSSRLGEGVINGLMTARIGIAAMDLCRPLPFRVVRRPGIGDFVGDLARIGQKDETQRRT
jgi:putative membrane protein